MGFQGRPDSEMLSEYNQTRASDHGVRRDEHGRFTGCGNPAGRPRKLKLPPPSSLSAALALQLQNDITIRVDGKPKTVPAFEAIAAKLVHSMMSGSHKDTLVALQHMQKLGVFDVLNSVQDYKDTLMEANSPSGWTPELEAKYRVVSGDYSGHDDEPSALSGVEDAAEHLNYSSEPNVDDLDLRSGWDRRD